MKIRRSVSTKKVSLAMLLLLNISMISAVAQAVDTETPADILQMSGRINDIQSTVDNIVQTMNTSSEPGSEIDISDYLSAKEALMTTIQTETDLFKRCVVEIRDQVQETVRVLDQELVNLRRAYRVTRADGIYDLIQIKESSRSGSIQSLERAVQTQYAGCVRRLVTLNSSIKILVGITDPERLLLKRSILGFMGSTVVLAPLALLIRRDAGLMDRRYIGTFFMGISVDSRDIDGDGYIDRRPTLGRFRRAAHRSMDEHSAGMSARLFQNCASQTCVFLLGDLYKVWLNQVREVNRDLDLIENVELKAVSMTRARRIERRMTNMIAFAARNYATSILLQE